MISINKRMLVLMEIPIFLLLIDINNMKSIIPSFLFSIISIFIIIKNYSADILCKTKSLKLSLISILINTYFGYNFFKVWLPSSLLQKLTFNSEMLKMIFLLVTTLAFVLCGSIFIYKLIEVCIGIINNAKTNDDKLENHNINFFELLFIACIAFVVITLCSRSSFLYPINNWDDANCFFTVGKSILNGRVMYKDIYEQKGPWLYFIHSIAYLISNKTFIGVYLIELICCFCFLLFSYKVALFFCDKKVIYMLPLMAALVYSSSSFVYGDSAEELCLPLLMFSLYKGIVCIKKRKYFSLIDSLMIGVTSGMVLWIKYTMLGFYIGFIIAICFDKLANKESIIPIIKNIIFIIIGVVMVSLPVIIYFGINNAFENLFEVYFYNNIFMYSGKSSDSNTVYNILMGIQCWKACYINSVISVIIGIIYIICTEHKLSKYYLCSFVTLFALIFYGSKRYAYYPFILSIYFIFAIIALYKIIKASILIKSNISNVLFMIMNSVISIIILLVSPNVSFIGHSKDELTQFKFAKIISQTENPTLLNYDFLDGGYYTVTGIVPNCRYFCWLNIFNYDKEMLEETNQYIVDGKTDYIVSDIEIDSDLYECVMESGGAYLYRLKNLK